jgi:cobalt/nickel transport system ATP-binding protein
MGLSDAEVDKRTRDCMELFSITELADKAPYHLSGGQKKRVALASVMALNPEVLILDEPYAGLDKKMQAFLMQFLSELKADGKTLIIATHDESLTASLADKVLDMNEKFSFS